MINGNDLNLVQSSSFSDCLQICLGQRPNCKAAQFYPANKRCDLKTSNNVQQLVPISGGSKGYFLDTSCPSQGTKNFFCSPLFFIFVQGMSKKLSFRILKQIWKLLMSHWTRTEPCLGRIGPNVLRRMNFGFNTEPDVVDCGKLASTLDPVNLDDPTILVFLDSLLVLWTFDFQFAVMPKNFCIA